MDLSTNIIRNVYNIGTNSCDAGTQYCMNEYALYFPCLKDITRGQKACFDFYIADGTTHDVVDLRTVDAISLNLNGQFNCSYGTFSYPDNISPLQTEEYSELYKLNFNDEEQCLLSVIMIDKDTKDILNIIGDECDSKPLYFWSNTEIKLKAEDTSTHIFVGWAIVDSTEDDCSDDTLEDYIISENKEYSFIIKENTIITAVYRERRKFNIVSDPDNESSYFRIDYDRTYYISNRDDGFMIPVEDSDYIPDGIDTIENVLEGYEIVVTCKPCISELNSDDDYSFVFKQWKDGNKEGCRKFIVGDTGCDGTSYFEDGNTIKLKAICTDSVPGIVEQPETDKIPNNNFEEEGIHLLNNPDDIYTYDYYGEDGYIKCENTRKHIDDGGYLYVDSGKLTLSSKGVENGIKIDIHAKSGSDSDVCEIEVRINDYAIDQEIDDFKNYEFYFTKCNGSDIEITVNGSCIIDTIIVYKEILIDGGKAQFCLNAETTTSIPPGPLSVNGAIAVGELGIDKDGNIIVKDPESYGLSSTPIGQINKLPKININIEKDE